MNRGVVRGAKKGRSISSAGCAGFGNRSHRARAVLRVPGWFAPWPGVCGCRDRRGGPGHRDAGPKAGPDEGGPDFPYRDMPRPGQVPAARTAHSDRPTGTFFAVVPYPAVEPGDFPGAGAGLLPRLRRQNVDLAVAIGLCAPVLTRANGPADGSRDVGARFVTSRPLETRRVFSQMRGVRVPSRVRTERPVPQGRASYIA